MKTTTRFPLILLSMLLIALLMNGGCTEQSGDKSVRHEEMNEGGVGDIGTMPLSEASKRLNYMIQINSDSLGLIEKMTSLEVKIEAVPAEAVSSEAPRDEDLFVPFTSAQINAALASTDLRFNQLLFGARSVVRLENDTLDKLLKRDIRPV